MGCYYNPAYCLIEMEREKMTQEEDFNNQRDLIVEEQKSQKKLLQRQCQHLKPNFTSAFVGQFDRFETLNLICQYCSKEIHIITSDYDINDYSKSIQDAIEYTIKRAGGVINVSDGDIDYLEYMLEENGIKDPNDIEKLINSLEIKK